MWHQTNGSTANHTRSVATLISGAIVLISNHSEPENQMVNIMSAFPSDYLKAADLQGQSARVTMDHIKMEDIGGDRKPVLYFQGKDRGLVLNKTNSNNIAAIYGLETDNWAGQQIELFEALVDFQGKTVPAIRVRPVMQQAAPVQQQGPQPIANPSPVYQDVGQKAPDHPQAPSAVDNINDAWEPPF